MDVPKGFVYKGKDLADKLKDMEETDSITWRLVERVMKGEYENLEQLHGEMDKTIEAIYKNIDDKKLSQEEKFAIKHLYLIGIYYTMEMVRLMNFMKPADFDQEQFSETGVYLFKTIEKLTKKAKKPKKNEHT